jgi:imidazolonepropionase
MMFQARRWLERMAQSGATTVEVRSSQGLRPVAEIRGLKLSRELDSAMIEVRAVITAEPADWGRGKERIEAACAVIERLGAAKRLASAIDLVCGPEGFSIEESRAILSRAIARGWPVKAQVERRLRSGGAELASSLAVRAVDHLNHIAEEDVSALAASGAVATLIPTTSFQRRERYDPPARRLIDGGVPVALATGFHGEESTSPSMAFILALSCRDLGISVEEAIAAATINGAAACGVASRLGSLEPGKQADLAIFEVGDYREVAYYIGVNLCVLTMKRGRVVHSAGRFAGIEE